jgi:hypothetical protein
MGLSYNEPSQPQLVPYMDLGGGLNTRLDPHALQRNELAASANLWSSYDQAIAKRPGTVPMGPYSDGSTGTGFAALALSSCRYHGATYLILLNTNHDVWVGPAAQYSATGTGTAWVKLTSVSASATFITTAQMYDAELQRDCVFICDGYSVPKVWVQDPFAITFVVQNVNTTAGHLPYKWNNTTTYITPQYVRTLGNNSHLFYSGDSTKPDAVYVSDPEFPQMFSNPAEQVVGDPTQNYQPAIIGANDGVEGGIITGMETIASVMVVFKQAAIYTMIQTTLLGEVPAWQVVQVSTSSGCQAPRSIARFPSFIIFLSIDGVYLTDGNTTQKVSGDVPTYFDNSLTGNPALITKRNLSVGARHGNRYELFFPIMTSAPYYNNLGVWFDFDKQSRFNNPIVGEIDNMNVAGIVALRGEGDDGNVAWADALLDRVGEFGVGYADFGQPITASFVGKADLFEDVFGPDEIAARKQMQDAYLLVELPGGSVRQNLDFYGTVIVDLGLSLGRVILQAIYTGVTGGEWGTANWGAMTWSASATEHFGVVKIPVQNAARGYVMQVAIKETSTVGWIAIGYGAYVNMGRTGY